MGSRSTVIFHPSGFCSKVENLCSSPYWFRLQNLHSFGHLGIFTTLIHNVLLLRTVNTSYFEQLQTILGDLEKFNHESRMDDENTHSWGHLKVHFRTFEMSWIISFFIIIKFLQGSEVAHIYSICCYWNRDTALVILNVRQIGFNSRLIISQRALSQE